MSERAASEQPRRVALAEAIATAWRERAVRYAVVHGLERYPDRIGRDLDVVLRRDSVRPAVEAAVACGRARGFATVLFRWSHWGLYQLVLLDSEASCSLAVDLLCTAGVWRAKWVRMVDDPLLERIVAGDGQVGDFRVSQLGRFLKSCVRPLLCGDYSRFGPGREWPLPVTPPAAIEHRRLGQLLGHEGVGALLSASSTGELRSQLRDGTRGLQRRWIRSHPLAAVRSVGDASWGRILRRLLNPAACVFVASETPDIAFAAAQDLVDDGRRMFLDVRPALMPTSRLSRIRDEATVWRAPPVSELVMSVVVGGPRAPGSSLGSSPGQRLPTARLALAAGLSREAVRDRLRACMLALLADTYPVTAFLDSGEPACSLDRRTSVIESGAPGRS